MRRTFNPPPGVRADRDRIRYNAVMAASRRLFLVLYLAALALGGQGLGRTLLAVATLLVVQKLFEAACVRRWVTPHRPPRKGPLRLRRALRGVDLDEYGRDSSDCT